MESDACFIQFEEFLCIKFADYKAVNIATLRNGSLTITSSSTLLHNSPDIKYSPNENHCGVSFQHLVKDTIISYGRVECTVIEGCKKRVNNITDLSIRIQKQVDIATSIHYSLFEILPFLKLFKKQELNSNSKTLLISITILILLTSTIIIGIHSKLSKSPR